MGDKTADKNTHLSQSCKPQQNVRQEWVSKQTANKGSKHHRKPRGIIEKSKVAATTKVIPEQFIGHTTVC
jgi:hypothetical protein